MTTATWNRTRSLDWLRVGAWSGSFAAHTGVLLLLLLIAAFSPRGPRRATALFLVVYCLIASFTETGLGEASPYLLDLAVAMSLLMMPATASPSGELVTPGLKL